MSYTKKQRAVKLLEKSVEFFGTNSWVRGTSHEKLANGKDAYCATGALNEVSKSFKSRDLNKSLALAREALDKAAFTASKGTLDDIVEYNDLYAKDKRYIVRVFKRAIAGLQTV